MEDKKKKGPRKAKPFFEHTVKCAWCGKPNKVKAIKETVEPAVPAQRTLDVFVEKDTQTSLVSE